MKSVDRYEQAKPKLKIGLALITKDYLVSVTKKRLVDSRERIKDAAYACSHAPHLRAVPSHGA